MYTVKRNHFYEWHMAEVANLKIVTAGVIDQ